MVPPRTVTRARSAGRAAVSATARARASGADGAGVDGGEAHDPAPQRPGHVSGIVGGEVGHQHDLPHPTGGGRGSGVGLTVVAVDEQVVAGHDGGRRHQAEGHPEAAHGPRRQVTRRHIGKEDGEQHHQRHQAHGGADADHGQHVQRRERERNSPRSAAALRSARRQNTAHTGRPTSTNVTARTTGLATDSRMAGQRVAGPAPLHRSQRRQLLRSFREPPPAGQGAAHAPEGVGGGGKPGPGVVGRPVPQAGTGTGPGPGGQDPMDVAYDRLDDGVPGRRVGGDREHFSGLDLGGIGRPQPALAQPGQLDVAEVYEQ